MYYQIEDIHLEYSVDDGNNWNLITNPCKINQANCQLNTPGTVYKSDQFLNGSSNRVIVMLPGF